MGVPDPEDSRRWYDSCRIKHASTRQHGSSCPMDGGVRRHKSVLTGQAATDVDARISSLCLWSCRAHVTFNGIFCERDEIEVGPWKGQFVLRFRPCSKCKGAKKGETPTFRACQQSSFTRSVACPRSKSAGSAARNGNDRQSSPNPRRRRVPCPRLVISCTTTALAGPRDRACPAVVFKPTIFQGRFCTSHR